jgi:hypothetical protein
MAILKLFVELMKSEIFYFYDRPDRKLVKSDSNHYAAPEGRRVISPTVAIFQDQNHGSGIPMNNSKGDSNES